MENSLNLPHTSSVNISHLSFICVLLLNKTFLNWPFKLLIGIPMVKKLFVILLSCSYIFLAACGASSDSQAPEDDGPQGINPPDNSQGFTQNMRLFGGGLQMCGISQDNAVYCWGKDNNGELGQAKNIPVGDELPNSTTTLTPRKVSGLPDIETMDADYSRSCAVDDGGSVWCWGKDFVSGDSSYTPKVVSQLNSITRITTSQESVCASNLNTDLFCWGYNEFAHLNVEDNSGLVENPSPFNWNQLAKTQRIAMASGSSCLLTPEGIPYCLGFNHRGGLGTGSETEHVTEPEAVIMTEGQSFTEISAGFDHFCALGTDKNVYCWGYSLSLDEFVNTPRKVENLSGITKITSFFEGGCALNEAGEVWCWGRNNSGVLGYKRASGDYWKNQAVQIELPGKATDIASAEYFNCAVGDESFQEDIYCWGSIASEHYLSTATDQPVRTNYNPIPLMPYTIED